jgi:cell division protein FtsW (lipid II flippase)
MYKFLQGRLLLVRLILLAAVLALVAAGLLSIYAVGHPAEPSPAGQTEDSSAVTLAKEDFANLWKKQLVFAIVAAVVFILVNLINYRRFGAASYWIYAFVLLLLGVLLVDKFVDLPFVPVINRARRWLKIGIGTSFIQVQPSEFCKLAYVLALAWYLRYRSNYRSFKALVGPFALTVLPMVLILLEPNLGTVMLMMPILFTMLFVAGAKVKHLLFIILLAVVVSPFMWHFMQPYQRIRISSVILQSKFIREKCDAHPKLAGILIGQDRQFSTWEKQWESDWGYHLIRAKYAVASGGAKGSGFRKGPFIKYNFLPERHNDFIFAVIAHQWGFLGCAALIALYTIIVWCGLEIAANNTDPFGRLLAIGIVATIAVEVVINISMTLGLMPITGLTLPLVSYGGSSLVVSAAAMGLLNNVGRCRPFSVARKPFS